VASITLACGKKSPLEIQVLASRHKRRAPQLWYHALRTAVGPGGTALRLSQNSWDSRNRSTIALTLALSQREREVQSASQRLPLPPGEGWGEGDKRPDSPNRGTIWSRFRLLRQPPGRAQENHAFTATSHPTAIPKARRYSNRLFAGSRLLIRFPQKPYDKHLSRFHCTCCSC